MLEIFWRFLILGLTSFGGPAAHIGYFRQVFVEKLNWMSSDHYAQTIALSQILPGPGSSQVGFAIGLHRAGVAGAISASIAFTLPSFLLLYALAIGADALQSHYWSGLIHGLKLLALVVVLDATIQMWRNFCKTRLSMAFAVMTAMLLLLLPNFFTQLVILLLVALIGSLWLQPSEKDSQETPLQYTEKHHSKGRAQLWLSITLGLFVMSFLPWSEQIIVLFSQYYQAGSLVFGGGHVVLPLLQQTVSDTVTTERFLTAYAAAQAVPGPLFTMASYLGAESFPHSPFVGALVATIAIFLPGFLLVLALHSHWHRLANRPKLAGAIVAVNASVVGFLLATLINPIVPAALLSWIDAVIALSAFVALRYLKLSVFWLILIFAMYGIGSAIIMTH